MLQTAMKSRVMRAKKEGREGERASDGMRREERGGEAAVLGCGC